MPPYNAYWATSRTGGGTGALDALDGSLLADKDMNVLADSTDTMRFWWLDADASGSEGETVTNPDTNPGTKSWLLLGVTLPNTGLHILDSDSTHDLIIKPGSDLSADRTLTLTTGDADRTLTLNENLTIGDGTNITITGVTAARTFTMNENFTIGDGNDGTLTFSASGDILTVGESLTLDGASGKTLTLEENLTVADGTDITLTGVTQANTLTLYESLTLGDGNDGTLTYSAASKTLTVEDNAIVSQDYSADSTTVSFAGLALSGNLALAANSITGTSVDINNAELQQLSNIGAATISGAQWGYLGACGAGGGQLLAGLTTGESTQLEAIGAVTINVTQWGYLGSSTASGGAVLTAANDAAILALLSGDAGAAFDWNSQNLTSVGTIVCGDITSSGFISSTDNAVNTTDDYEALNVDHTKTAGATANDDDMTGALLRMIYNQNGATIGHLYGIDAEARVTAGGVGDAGAAKHVYSMSFVTNLDGGKVWGSAYGIRSNVDQEGGNEVVGDAYGIYVTMDMDGTLGGTAYMLYLKENSNIDYGIYQSGTAPNHFGGDVDINVHDAATVGLKLGGTLVTASAAELNYSDGVTSAIQTQLDARCLESVFGTSISTGLLLDGTALKASAILQKYHGIDPSANVQSLLGAANYAAMLALLTAQAGAAFSWNSQNLTSVGTIGCNTVTIASGQTLAFTDGGSADIIRDEDNMVSDDVNALCSQQSIKAYVDAEVASGGVAFAIVAALGTL